MVFAPWNGRTVTRKGAGWGAASAALGVIFPPAVLVLHNPNLAVPYAQVTSPVVTGRFNWRD